MTTNSQNQSPDHAAADNDVLDAALESVAAEVQSKPPQKNSPADQKVAGLEQQVREANDRALRSHAELENYRKRSQRELVEERRYAVVPLVRDLLAVVDNLERAIEAGTRDSGLGTKGSDREARPSTPSPEPLTPNPSSLLDGVKMVATQFESILKQHDCVRIETVGAPFDPNLHQALAQEPSDEHPAGVITRAPQSGYKLHDRVIRPAQVFVSTGPSKKPE